MKIVKTSEQALALLVEKYPNTTIKEMEGNPNIFGSWAFWVGKEAALVDDQGYVFITDSTE